MSDATGAARRIVAGEGEWTAGDARACAEFVLAAQDELRERVVAARAALAEGEEATVAYLRGGSRDARQALERILLVVGSKDADHERLSEIEALAYVGLDRRPPWAP